MEDVNFYTNGGLKTVSCATLATPNASHEIAQHARSFIGDLKSIHEDTPGAVEWLSKFDATDLTHTIRENIMHCSL